MDCELEKLVNCSCQVRIAIVTVEPFLGFSVELLVAGKLHLVSSLEISYGLLDASTAWHTPFLAWSIVRHLAPMSQMWYPAYGKHK